MQVSHAWKNPFILLLQTIRAYLSDSDSSSTRVWVDVLAVNQAAGSQHNKADVNAFADVLKASSHGTIVVMDDNVIPVTRSWCIYEWVSATY